MIVFGVYLYIALAFQQEKEREKKFSVKTNWLCVHNFFFCEIYTAVQTPTLQQPHKFNFFFFIHTNYFSYSFCYFPLAVASTWLLAMREKRVREREKE